LRLHFVSPDLFDICILACLGAIVKVEFYTCSRDDCKEKLSGGRGEGGDASGGGGGGGTKK